MMGEQTGLQPKIFYPHLNLEQRVPRTHLLRRIQEQIDFNFIYSEVRESYGSKGNVSIPPPVILKMMLLLVLYNVRSEKKIGDGSHILFKKSARYKLIIQNSGVIHKKVAPALILDFRSC